MRTRFGFPVALLLAASLFVVAAFLWRPALAQDKDKVVRPVVKWEYKLVPSATTARAFHASKTEEILNKEGQMGWECIATVSEVASNPNGTYTTVFLICKRPKQ